MHGLFFGRIAPSSRQRRGIEAPALIVGHPADPIHPAADAAMLAEEMPHATFVRAHSILEWRVAPTGSTGRRSTSRSAAGRPRGAGVAPATGADTRAGAPACALRGPWRQNGAVLYRDEAIVLRTHKLGEADRIVTLLTRQHGRVRAVAKGVRRTTSRFGSRLEPFTHVDLQLAEGRNLDVITQAETIQPFAPGSACTTTATPPAP